MPNLSVARGLGALTGVVGLIAMIRLVAGAFSGGMSIFAWAVTLLAMVPWIGYCAWRAGHGRLGPRNGLAVLGLDVAGLVAVWVFVLGPVIALAFSLAAFAIIWVSDWPDRRPRGEDTFVRIEELQHDEPG